jgi:septation ring formation regulator EzrA
MASENSDDPNFEISLSPGSLDENQVEKACEDLRVKNAELKKAINHMIKENTLYKKKYNEMKSQLTDLNKLLEKNAQVFHQLFDDAQSALQMGRTSILNSPAIHNRLSVRKANPKIPVTILPSTSNTSQSKSMTRRRLHIEPINMSELQETGENNVSTVVAEISEQPEQDSTLREGSGSDYIHCPIAPKKQNIHL